MSIGEGIQAISTCSRLDLSRHELKKAIGAVCDARPHETLLQEGAESAGLVTPLFMAVCLKARGVFIRFIDSLALSLEPDPATTAGCVAELAEAEECLRLPAHNAVNSVQSGELATLYEELGQYHHSVNEKLEFLRKIADGASPEKLLDDLLATT